VLFRPTPESLDSVFWEWAIDILAQTTRPLYIQEILEQLEQRGLSATRDSLVSALTKVIAPAGPVVRVAPNTFTVKGQ